MTRTASRKVLLVVTMLLSLALLLAACGGGNKTAASKPAGPTAKSGLEKARAKLTTTAPDAKLLVVQTAQAVSPTATPVWAYLFGSPKTDKLYAVYLTQGNAMPAQESGTAGLSKEEWAKVPGVDAWKIDSDAAYEKALAVSGAKGAPAQYIMGFLTYVPAKDTSAAIQPFVWNVQFDPGSSGATTSTIEVNASTGEAKIKK